MELAEKVVLIVLAAAVGEGINEFFFLPWFDFLKEDEPKEETPEAKKKRLWKETIRVQFMRLWSGVVGILIAWELSLDVFDLLGAQILHVGVGYVLTGLLLGRGSNFVHKLIKRFVTGKVVR